MGENGDGEKIEVKEETQEQKPQAIEMRIVAEPGLPVKVHFPFLIDKVATYGFLKLAEKVIDAHYAQQEPKIVPARGGFRNLFRR